LRKDLVGKESPSLDDFEKKLERLREVVKKMEEGNLPLSKSLELFEEGINLYRDCTQMIESAEQRINIIIKDADDTFREESFYGIEGGNDEL